MGGNVVAPANYYADGWRDDGTESGILRAEPSLGGMVPVPFRRGYIAQSSSAGVSFNPGASIFTDNDDGTQSGLYVNIPASAALGNYCSVYFHFMGSRLGLRLSRQSFYVNPIGIMIDGIAYDVKNSLILDPAAQLSLSIPGQAFSVLVASDLPDTAHVAQLIFPGSTTVTRSWGLHGFLADSKYYAPLPRGVTLGSGDKYTLSSSFQTVPGFTSPVYGIAKIIFYNPTAAAVAAQVRYSSSAGVFWSRQVQPNDTLEYIPSRPVYHSLDVGGQGLVATIEGLI